MSFQYQHHQHEVRHIRLNRTTTCHLLVHTAHAKDQRVTSIHSFRTGSQGNSIRQEFFYTPVCGAGLPKPGDTSSRNILACLAL